MARPDHGDELMPSQELAIGTKVRAKWGGGWYPAEVVDKGVVGSKMYEVRFSDMTSRWMSRSELRTFPEAEKYYQGQIRGKRASPHKSSLIANGTMVTVKTVEGENYPGVVTNYDGATSYEIENSATNEKRWVTKANLELPLPKPDEVKLILGTSVVAALPTGRKFEGIITAATDDCYQVESMDGPVHWVRHHNVTTLSRDVPLGSKVSVEYLEISGEGVVVSISATSYSILMQGKQDPVEVPKFAAVELGDLLAAPTPTPTPTPTPVENGATDSTTPARKKVKKRKSGGNSPTPPAEPELLTVKDEPGVGKDVIVESATPTPEPSSKKRKKKRTTRTPVGKMNTTPQAPPPEMTTPAPTTPAPVPTPPDATIRKRKNEELNLRDESLLGQDVYVLIEGKLLLCRVTDAQQQKLRVNWYRANNTEHVQCQHGCKLPPHKTLKPTDSYSWIDEINVLPMKVHVLDDVSLQHTYYLKRET